MPYLIDTVPQSAPRGVALLDWNRRGELGGSPLAYLAENQKTDVD